MAATTAPIVSTQVPWLDLVRFHRAIVQRAEDGFWSLDGGNSNSERWTSLDGFTLPTLDGPWVIDPAQMVSSNWCDMLARGRLETVYLAGPCFVGSAQLRGQWQACWQPLLYREVQLQIVEDGLEIRPVGDMWSVSPPVHTFTDRQQVHTGMTPDEISASIVRSVREALERGEIGTEAVVRRELLRIVPELKQILLKSPDREFGTVPSTWVLFGPPRGGGQYNQHLMRDYDLMEQHLSQGGSGSVGGLSLLQTPSSAFVAAHAEVLPFAPLNAAQERAVGAMLAGRPVTVVSGPPGCGKSQVVVSLLLNAWARGESVLFASNNNQAVKVVEDRLVEFNTIRPVSIRAGNTASSNIASVLRRIVQESGMSAQLRAGANLALAAQRRSVLREERRRIVEELDTERPQRIDQAARSASATYARFEREMGELNARYGSLSTKLAAIVGRQEDPDDALPVAEATRQWAETVRQLIDGLDADAAERLALDAESRRLEAAARDALSSMDISGSMLVDPAVVGDARALLATLTAWHAEARAEFSAEALEQLGFTTWASSHDRWQSPEEAHAAARLAGTLADRLDELLARAPEVVAAAEQERHAFDDAWQSLVGLGWPTAVRKPAGDLDVPRRWLEGWGAFITLPPGRWNPRSFIARRRIRASLAELEPQLHSRIPLEVWRSIGPLTDQGRDRLADVLDQLIRHGEARERQSRAAASETAVAAELDALRPELSRCLVSGPLHVLDLDGWSALPAALRQHAVEALEASAAWMARFTRERVRREVHRLARTWCDDLGRRPSLRGWCDHRGSELHQALTSLEHEVTTASFAAVGRRLEDGAVAELTRALASSLEHYGRMLEMAARRDAIPTVPQRIVEAWAARRDHAMVVDGDRESWPDLTIVAARLDQLAAWHAEWKHFSTYERPEALRKAEQERTLAVNRLREAVDLLPSTAGAEALRTRVDQVLADRDERWPVGELHDRFLAFTPEPMRAQLASINGSLTDTAMADATHGWADRLSTEVTALKAVSQLIQRAGDNGQGNLVSVPDLFRQALQLASIWITTAQGTRAIPLAPQLFDLVVIDEASQCTLTNLLPIIFRAKRIVVIGDPQQLLAIDVISPAEQRVLAQQFEVTAQVAELGHCARNLYVVASEALPGQSSDVVMLDEHYRSDPLIIGFANRYVYQRQLKLRRGPGGQIADGLESGVHKIDVRGSAERRHGGGSWQNRREAQAVVDRVLALQAANIPSSDIGVVTPFAGQKQLIRELLKTKGTSEGVHVDTAFGFQGDEREVILFSPVIDSTTSVGTRRWVEDPVNLINVALTRAKNVLYVVANFEALAKSPGILCDLARYVDDVNVLRESSAAELALFTWMSMEGWMPAVHPTVQNHATTFTLAEPFRRRVAVIVRPLTFLEQPGTPQERERRTALEAAGYRVVETIGRDVLQTPTTVVHRIRSAMLDE